MKQVLLLMFLFFALFFVACGMPSSNNTEEKVPLSKGTNDLVASKGSKVLSLRRDYRKCVSPMCGGYWVTTIHHRKMQCIDGTWARSCYVAKISWQSLNISIEQQRKLESRIDKVWILGVLHPQTFGTHKLGVLLAKKAWAAATDKAPKGYAFRVEDRDIRCIKAPCSLLKIYLLNYTWNRSLGDLNLKEVGADRKQLQAAHDALLGKNLLVAGHFRWILRKENHQRRWILQLKASQFYLPVKPIKPALDCISDNDCKLVPSDSYNSHDACYCSACGLVSVPQNAPAHKTCADGICALPPCAAPQFQTVAVCRQNKCTSETIFPNSQRCFDDDACTLARYPKFVHSKMECYCPSLCASAGITKTQHELNKRSWDAYCQKDWGDHKCPVARCAAPMYPVCQHNQCSSVLGR